MRALTYTAIRSDLARTMSMVCEDHEPVIVTRRNHLPVVMISLDDYDSLKTTAYLLRSPRNARRLMDSIRELDSGGGTVRRI